MKGLKEKKKGSEGWRYEINYFPLNFNESFHEELQIV
jgi:hypothetical protein